MFLINFLNFLKKYLFDEILIHISEILAEIIEKFVKTLTDSQVSIY
jgi:hypothetical protein